jgi:hypothetical protein
MYGKMLKCGNFTERKLEVWLIPIKAVISFTFFGATAKILVNNTLTFTASDAQVIVSKRLLCHYVTWKIAALFNQGLRNAGGKAHCHRPDRVKVA